MTRHQREQIVQAVLDGAGALNVLTTMQPDWGGWVCDWVPNTLQGMPVVFSRILYQDGTVFRLCR